MEHTDALFLQRVIENAVFQYDHCEQYRQILKSRGFSREKILQMKSPAELPFLPTLYFKHHRLLSVPEKKLKLKSTSSGTSGNKSFVGFDLKSLRAGLGMVLTIGRRHKLLVTACLRVAVAFLWLRQCSLGRQVAGNVCRQIELLCKRNICNSQIKLGKFKTILRTLLQTYSLLVQMARKMLCT